MNQPWVYMYSPSWPCFWTVVLKMLEIPLDCKEIQPVHPKGNQSCLNIHWKDWFWSWNSNTLATWCKELTHLKRPWCWERLKEGGEGDDRGWDGWMASQTQWTWVWVNSGSWTGKPGMLQSMGSQRVGHDWATELNWTIPGIWEVLVSQTDKYYPLTEHIELYTTLSGRDTGDKQIQQNKMPLLLSSLLFPVILSLSPTHTYRGHHTDPSWKGGYWWGLSPTPCHRA